MTTPVDLAGIIERTEDEIRRRGMLVDTFGPEHHYVPKAGDGHDDYDCAAADRRALLGLLRETREALAAFVRPQDWLELKGNPGLYRPVLLFSAEHLVRLRTLFEALREAQE